MFMGHFRHEAHSSLWLPSITFCPLIHEILEEVAVRRTQVTILFKTKAESNVGGRLGTTYTGIYDTIHSDSYTTASSRSVWEVEKLGQICVCVWCTRWTPAKKIENVYILYYMHACCMYACCMYVHSPSRLAKWGTHHVVRSIMCKICTYVLVVLGEQVQPTSPRAWLYRCWEDSNHRSVSNAAATYKSKIRAVAAGSCWMRPCTICTSHDIPSPVCMYNIWYVLYTRIIHWCTPTTTTAVVSMHCDTWHVEFIWWKTRYFLWG